MRKAVGSAHFHGAVMRVMYAAVCHIGRFDCRFVVGDRAVVADPLFVVADHLGVWQDGKTLTVTNWGRWYLDGFSFPGEGCQGRADRITTTFTIIEPASVTLPASAALLSLGIGALAMMRRRLRSI